MTTLSDNQKLLALTLVIETIIKPSNKYYTQAIIKIQRFWRRRSGYYGFRPLSERTIQKTSWRFHYRYHHLVPPPLIKRQMHSCGGNCLSHQQKKRDTIMRKAFTKFSKEINQRMRDTLDFPSLYYMAHPIGCICNNYENNMTLEKMWKLIPVGRLWEFANPITRKRLSRLQRNKIYLTLAQDNISWVTRNIMINFLKSKNIIT